MTRNSRFYMPLALILLLTPLTASAQTKEDAANTHTQQTDADGAPTAQKLPAIENTSDADAEEPARSTFIVTLNTAQPLGNTQNFINKFSFEGIGCEYRFRFSPTYSVGATFAWNTFILKQNNSFNLGNTQVTGTRIKTLVSMPLLFSLNREFITKNKKVVPFWSFYAGAYYVSRAIDYAYWMTRNASWHFGAAPELGIRLAESKFPIYLAARYNFIVGRANIASQSYFNINIGFYLQR